MADSINSETQFRLIREIASALKLFVLGNFFWALPSIIPTMEPFYEYTSVYYEWATWVTSALAVVLFLLSAIKISNALK